MQSDEEARVLLKEEAKKTEAQARYLLPPESITPLPIGILYSNVVSACKGQGAERGREREVLAEAKCHPKRC